MALAIGNSTANTITPGSSSFFTFSHNQNSGSDGYLIVSVAMYNVQSFSSVTYDGVAMTKLNGDNFSGTLSQQWAVYGLATPSTGSNTVRVNISGSQWNPVGYYAQSFTGSGGVGVNSFVNEQTISPREG